MSLQMFSIQYSKMSRRHNAYVKKENKEASTYYFRCLGDLRKTTGPLVYTIFSSFIIATFIANVLCYFGVWTVIMTTAKQINVRFYAF